MKLSELLILEATEEAVRAAQAHIYYAKVKQML